MKKDKNIGRRTRDKENTMKKDKRQGNFDKKDKNLSKKARARKKQ